MIPGCRVDHIFINGVEVTPDMAPILKLILGPERPLEYPISELARRSISCTATFDPEDMPTIRHFIRDVWADVIAFDRWEDDGGPG